MESKHVFPAVVAALLTAVASGGLEFFMTGELTPLIAGLFGMLFGSAYLAIVYLLRKWRNRRGVPHSADASTVSHYWQAPQPSGLLTRASISRRIMRFLGKGKQRGRGELGIVTVAGKEGSGRAIPTHRSNFWKWLWYRATGTSGKRRLQNVADLQRCLDELIKYSGFPVTEKVTSEQIEASNALLRHLRRAAAILDEQGEPHPKIEKGLTVINHTEWIEFLSKRLAQADAR